MPVFCPTLLAQPRRPLPSYAASPHIFGICKSARSPLDRGRLRRPMAAGGPPKDRNATGDAGAALPHGTDHRQQEFGMFRPLVLSALYFAAIGTVFAAYALVPA